MAIESKKSLAEDKGLVKRGSPAAKADKKAYDPPKSKCCESEANGPNEMTPQTVIITALSFMMVVLILHVLNVLYRYISNK